MNFKLAILIALACLASSQALSSKITNRLQESLVGAEDAKLNIFVSVQGGIRQALAGVASQQYKTRASRSSAVYKALTQNAQQSQKDVIGLLDTVVARDSSVKVKSFWISNQVYVQGANRDLIEALASLEQVTKIDEEAIHHIDPPVSSVPVPKRDSSIRAPQWHLLTLQVPEVWEAPWGSNGTGVIVGVIDTGVRATHEAIRDRYVNDGFSWRDPYNQFRIPTDNYDHGTHVTGSVVGRDGIGIAPEARFIACKGYRDDGSALVSAFFECGQFLVCPTDVDGNNPDCTKTVHVAQNSWGLALGGGDYREVLDVWHAVGIMPIFANGNYGPTCGIVYSPADNIGAIGIGATDSNDRLASFSGRGPSEFGVLKPDYSAPGVNIYSCDRRSDTSYSVKSGTSMASPVAAGAAALMVGSKPDVSYQQLKFAFESTATRNVPALGESCGGVSDNIWPNNAYGYGRINAYDAIRSVLNMN